MRTFVRTIGAIALAALVALVPAAAASAKKPKGAAWAKQHRTAAMLGEFGVLNFCVDATSRTRWVHDVRAAAEASGIGWTYWEADQGFGFIADRTATGGIDDTMVAALLA